MRGALVLALILLPAQIHMQAVPDFCLTVKINPGFSEAFDCSTISGSGHNPRPVGVTPNFRPVETNYCRRP
jgi:hypothetical protein